jgi:hypothetical protein
VPPAAVKIVKDKELLRGISLHTKTLRTPMHLWPVNGSTPVEPLDAGIRRSHAEARRRREPHSEIHFESGNQEVRNIPGRSFAPLCDLRVIHPGTTSPLFASSRLRVSQYFLNLESRKLHGRSLRPSCDPSRKRFRHSSRLRVSSVFLGMRNSTDMPFQVFGRKRNRAAFARPPCGLRYFYVAQLTR